MCWAKNSTAIKRFDNTPLMLQELYEDGISATVGDGTYAKIYASWFDNNVPDLPAE